MKKTLADLVYPHYCCYCNSIGGVLCDSCYNNIISDKQSLALCIVCLKHCDRDLCVDCRAVFSEAWFCGWRQGALKKLIDNSKYYSQREGCLRQAELLNHVIDNIDDDYVVTYVPTSRVHIRQRGYDHSYIIARKLAKLKGLRFDTLIERLDNSVQIGSSLEQRVSQAKLAYGIKSLRNVDKVLLVDDVYTTGSTLNSIAHKLLLAGVERVAIAVTARQKLG